MGRVGRRRVGVASPRAKRSAKRARAKSRLRAWERSSWATATTLGPKRANRRSRWASSSAVEASTSKLASTREAVTFACCPPGPEERLARTVISARGIAKSSVTRKGGKRGTEESNLEQGFWRPPCYRYTSPPKGPGLRAVWSRDAPGKAIARSILGESWRAGHRAASPPEFAQRVRLSPHVPPPEFARCACPSPHMRPPKPAQCACPSSHSAPGRVLGAIPDFANGWV